MGLTKRELLRVERERAKLDRALGGIKEMGGLPDILFIVDTNKEDIAVQEATKLGLPVIAVIDSNSSPEGVTYPIQATTTQCVQSACTANLSAAQYSMVCKLEMVASGVDVGELDEPAAEAVPEADAASDVAEAEAPVAEEAAKEAPAAEETAEAAPEAAEEKTTSA